MAPTPVTVDGLATISSADSAMKYPPRPRVLEVRDDQHAFLWRKRDRSWKIASLA
jgi:uncharacterized protein YhdP